MGVSKCQNNYFVISIPIVFNDMCSHVIMTQHCTYLKVQTLGYTYSSTER